MSDLSRLLDDIYGDTADDAADGGAGNDLLGDTGWLDDLTVPVEAPEPADLHPTAPVDLTPLPALGDDAEPTGGMPAVTPSGWQRSDDDILPGGRSGGRLRRRQQPTVADAAATPIEAFAAPAGDEAELAELVSSGRRSRFRRKRT